MAYIIILIGVVTVALIFFIVRVNRTTGNKEANDETAAEARTHVPPVTCCGAHEVCEAETLLAMSDKIIYYDDEELDAYRGLGPDDYSDEQIDEFREILLTLQTHEVAGWLRSLNLRKIELPSEIRDEALMIVSDFREERRNATAAPGNN